MVQKRHPQVAGIMLQGLNGGDEMASLNVARDCVASLADAGCELPSWFELVDGVRPPVPEDTGDPFQPRQGWQHFASNTVEELHLREALPTLPPPQRALVRSQGGPLSSRPFVARLHDSPSSRPSLSVCCSSVVSTCPSPCPPATAGVAVHSTALAMRGCRVLGRRGFAVESAIARICREGGARVSMNVFVRDLDLGPFNHLDGRRLEVVADGLSLFGGAQLAIDTTLEPCVGMALQGKAQPIVMALPSGPHTDERKGLALNLRVQGDVLGWSSLPARLAGVGRPRQHTSCGLWQLRRLETFPTFCKPASRLLGSAVGPTSSHVQHSALSLILCWK